MPASFIKDEDTWAKAKAAAKKSNPDDFYAAAVSIYKQMGGKIKGRGKETVSTSQLAALLRKPPSKEAQVGLVPTRVNLDRREVECIIITEGPGNRRDRNYYTAEAIRDAVVKFEGARAFINHQTREERTSRPEGDIKDLAGYYKGLRETQVRNERGDLVSACSGTLACDKTPAGDEGLAKAVAAIRYAEEFKDRPTGECYAGISINADGIQQGTMEVDGEDGWAKIVGFMQARSADIVTRPARGGRFIQLLESVAWDEVRGSNRGGKDMGIKQLKAKVAEAEAELAKAQGEARKKAEESLATASAQLVKAVMEAEDEADEEEDDKADGKDGDGDQDGADGSEADEEDETEAEAFKQLSSAMKGLVPKKEDESEAGYSVRLAKAMKLMRPGKAAKKESLTLADLKATQPKVYQALRTQILESEGSKDRDFKALREELREAKMELQLLKDGSEATRMLAESGIPEKYLTTADLLGLDRPGQERLVARTKKMLEDARGGAALGNLGGKAGKPAAKGDLTAALESSGLPLLKQ